MHAEELELINRPVNTGGLTGLIMTTSPFTLPPRTVEFGVATMTERSFVPKYSSTSVPMTLSLGISANKEVAVQAPYRYVDRDTAGKSRGMGDAELSFKWTVVPQPEYSMRPAVALFATGILPTGDRDTGMNSVMHWGGRLGVSVGSEMAWDDVVIGLYADVQGAVQDASDPELRDSYSLANAGILVPISKYRNLQALVEYNLRTGKDVIYVDGTDFSAVTYGLRLVSERFNMTFGAQFLRKREQGYDNSSKTIGAISIKY